MSFRDPIIGGDGDLIREQIRSPDFVTGNSGWQLGRDGTAELNNLIARGSISVGADTEPQVIIDQSASQGFINFPVNTPSELIPAGIRGAPFNIGLATEHASLQINGPSMNGATDRLEMLLSSQNDDGTSQANMLFRVAGDPPMMTMDQNHVKFFQNTTPYNPVWTASVANPVIGTGTLVGEYFDLGFVVFVRILMTAGNTTTFGNGAYGFSLPIAPGSTQSMSAFYIDSSASNRFPGSAILTATQDVFRIPINPAGSVGLGSGSLAWGTGDQICVTGFYFP